MDERLRRLSAIGDQLEDFTGVVDCEIFRAELDAALAYGDGAKGGCPPLDQVFGALTRTDGIRGFTLQSSGEPNDEQSFR